MQRAPLIKQLFEAYATGNYTVDKLRDMATDLGLRMPRSGKPLTRSRVHRILQNPIYYGPFLWKGQKYVGKHEPIISKELFDEVRYQMSRRRRGTRVRKRNFAFTGLVKCEKCGCAYTAELQRGRHKSGKYIYYRCTEKRGKCGNKYVREEDFAKLLGGAIKALQVNDEILSWLRACLEDSQSERKKFSHERTMQLQNRYNSLQSAVDCAYEDRVQGVISEKLFTRKSVAWRNEMAEIEVELERLRKATEMYHDEGLKLLELAQVAHQRYLTHSNEKKAEMLRIVGSNYSFDGVSISPTYRKPFDVLANLASDEEWRPERDLNPR